VAGADGVAVAFAIGKKVGNAVVRNRIRRRLRALFDAPRPPLPTGIYLVKVAEGTGSLTYDELSHHLDVALSRLIPR
jgi:ribonuclease P protein component